MTPIKFSKVGHTDSHESNAPSNTLWVGNLAADVSDSNLMCLFAKFGALDCVPSYTARNYAFVYFKRVEDAAAAKDTLQSTLVRGNSLKIEFARSARPCKLLWVGGISPAVSKEQLKEEFLKFGKIEDFVFNRERNSAFIEFLTIDDAVEAMRNLNRKPMGGDQIRVDFLRSHTIRRDQLADIHDLKESQFSDTHTGVRRVQPSGGRKEGPPSKVLWVGYPPSVQIDEQMLHNAMILFGEIEKITSFPSRYYSFVEFRSVDEARRAKEGLQGRLFNEPRISIMYSSSGLAPGTRGPRPEISNEHVFGSSQLEMLDHPRPVGRNTLSGPMQPSSIRRPNLPERPFGSQAGFDPALSGSKFNDLAHMHTLIDGNSNISLGSNRRRPSSPGAGMPPASRLKPNQYQREPKRSRIDSVSPIDDDSFPIRKIDNRGLSLERTYRFPPVTGAGASGSFVNGQRKHSLSPVGVTATVGSSQHRAGDDHIWHGMIAKGGTPVCHARCVPLDNGTEMDLPEVVNCSARTGLDLLAKHCAQAIGFDVVYFLPDSEDDFASYTEFLHYLGSKNRAGVAKFDDGATLFLVPPSDFLTDVLNVKGPERLYGVVLKLPQVATSASVEPQLRQPSHFPQYINKHPVPPIEPDYNRFSRKEEQMPMSYNGVFREEKKSPLEAKNQASVSELIATIASFLPAKAQSASVEGGQQIPASSIVGQQIPGSSLGGQQIPGPSLGGQQMPNSSLGTQQIHVSSSFSQQVPGSFVRPPFSPFVADKGTSNRWKQSGNPSNFQYGSQFNSQSQIQPSYQPYPPHPNATSSSENTIPGGTQVQDSSVNIPHLGGMQSRPSVSAAMTSQNGPLPMVSQSGQVASSPQVSQQYPVGLAHQNGYGGASHGTDNSGISYSPSVVQQPVNPMIFSSQTQGSNHSHTQPQIPNNQVQQFQSGPPGPVQGSSEAEVDKNQRYQSTLQFAASLLLQIQQKQQQQQTGNAAVQGAGNQQ